MNMLLKNWLKTNHYKFFVLFFVITGLSCGVNLDEPGNQYHFKVTIDSNLKKIDLGNILVDSLAVYPFTILEETGNGEVSGLINLNPIVDTGYIRFTLYSAVGLKLPPLQLRDTLLVKTPMDTTYFKVTVMQDNTNRIEIYKPDH